MKCALVDCEKEAEVAPRLCIPFEGVGREESAPFKLTMDVTTCRECFPRVKASQFIRHDLKVYVRQCIAKKPPPAGARWKAPDWDRSWLESVALDSEAYETMKAALKTGEVRRQEFQIGGAKK